MKTYTTIIAGLMVSSLIANAQETTYGGKRNILTNSTEPIARVMVVSFEDKMYRSHVDRDIGHHNKMTQPEVRRLFQQAIPAKIATSLGSDFDVMAYEDEQADSRENASTFIHESLQYKFEDIKEEQDSNRLKRVFKKPGVRNHEKQQLQDGISEGQIRTGSNTREKYTKAIIRDDSLLNHLNQSYNFDYLMIISELDFTYLIEDPNMAAYGGIKKELTTHYTIYSNEGKMISGGVKKTHFNNQDNDVHLIVEEHLPKLTDQIVKSFESIVLAGAD